MGGCHSVRTPKQGNLRRKYFIAASSGNLATLKICLEKWDQNVSDTELPSGYSALHKAVDGNHLECVQYLLQMGIKTHFQSFIGGHTALMLAAQMGLDTVVELLLKAEDCPINSKTHMGGNTALHLAILRSHEKVVTALLKAHNINLEVESSGGTPIKVAFRNVQPSIAMQLLKAGSTLPKTTQGRSYIDVYMTNKDDRMNDLFEYLVEHHLDPDYVSPDGLGYLHIAVQKHRKDLLSKFIKKEVFDVNFKATKSGLTALHLATRDGATNMVSMLVGAGADVNICSDAKRSPLHTAVYVNSVETVGILLGLRDSKGTRMVDIEAKDSRLTTPLQLAFGIGSSTMIVDLLISAGADVRVTDEDQRSLLHSAVTSGSVKMLEKVIEHKAPNRVDKNGSSPLGLACELMNVELIQALLKLCPEHINLADSKGNTPLMLALEKPGQTWSRQQKDIFMELLEKGADVTVNNTDGITPIEKAQLSNNVFAVKALAEKNCKLDTEICDKDGNTKLHQAADDLNLDMVKCLLGAGANVNALNKDKQTPLLKTMNAVSLEVTGNQEQRIENIAKQLLSHGGRKSINQKESSGYTALYLAVMRKFPNLVELFLTNGASVNIKANNGIPLLHSAARLEDSVILNSLIRLKSQELVLEITDLKGDTAMSAAFWTNRKENFAALQRAGATIPDEIEEMDLVSLIRDGKLRQAEIILDLRKGGAEERTESSEMSSLEAALSCRFGLVFSVDFVKKLIQHGASVNGVTVGKMPYTFFSLVRNRHDIFYELLKQGADPLATFGNKTLLHAALENPDMPKEKEAVYLLNHGGESLANKCFVGASKIPPLMMAVLSRSVTVVASLLQCGADPDYRLIGRITHKKSGRFFGSCTPLELALCLKQEKIVKLLLLAGADVNAVKRTIYTNKRHHPILSVAGLSQLLIVAGSLKREKTRVLMSRQLKKDSSSGEKDDDDDDEDGGSSGGNFEIWQTSSQHLDSSGACDVDDINVADLGIGKCFDSGNFSDKDSARLDFTSLATGNNLDSFGPSFDSFCSSFTGVSGAGSGGGGCFTWSDSTSGYSSGSGSSSTSGGGGGGGGWEGCSSSYDHDSHDSSSSGWGGGGGGGGGCSSSSDSGGGGGSDSGGCDSSD